MLCPNCNISLNDGELFCPICGTALNEDQQPQVTTEQSVYSLETEQVLPDVAQKNITEDDLPEQFRPLGPWAYFGLNLLFTIPIVGFVFLIVFSFNSSNINRRNYARSYWCTLIIVGTVLVVGLILSLLLFRSVPHNVHYY